MRKTVVNPSGRPMIVDTSANKCDRVSCRHHVNPGHCNKRFYAGNPPEGFASFSCPGYAYKPPAPHSIKNAKPSKYNRGYQSKFEGRS